jgi:nitroreductase
MVQLLRKRRSIRKYQKKPVEGGVRKILEEALLRSPSSRDIKPWQFIFVDDRTMLRRLSRCKEHGAGFLAGAALGVVICADESKSDVWIEDCAIASILLQMAAMENGIGSCWIQVRNRMAEPHLSSEEFVRKALSLAGNIRVESIISLGYPAEDKKGVAAQSLDAGKIVSYEPPRTSRVNREQVADNFIHVKEINRALRMKRASRKVGR